MPPTQKRTKSQKLRRASHFALHAANIVTCKKCGQPRMAHSACPSCGTYRNKTL